MRQIVEPTKEVLTASFQKLKTSFLRGDTLSISRRKHALQRFKEEYLRRENEVNEAVKRDLGLNAHYSYLAGTMNVITEIDLALRKLDKWTKPIPVETPITLFPSKMYDVLEPLGVVLVIGAWNYPIATTLLPVISAIAAGNCVIAKPSEQAPYSSKVIVDIMNAVDQNCYLGFEGAVPTSVALNKMAFDLIVFTGGTFTGKMIMKDASENLCKVLLELGGKNPTIVDIDANIPLAAKRIVNFKFMNAGQTCVTADMVYVAKRIKEDFMAEVIKAMRQMLGNDAKESNDYSRIVSENHTNRVLSFLEGQTEKIAYQSGTSSLKEKFIAPTILVNPEPSSKVMMEEVFGPILPVIEFENIREVIEQIHSNDKPLGIYYFGSPSSANYETLKRETSSGALLCNDLGMQYVNFASGFGGVGPSGVGKIRGIEGFKYCSNQKVVIERSASGFMDLPFRYAPTNAAGLKKLRFIGKYFASYTIEEFTRVIKAVGIVLLLVLIMWFLLKKGIVVINI